MLSGLVPALNQAAAHRPRASEMPETAFGARERLIAQAVRRRGRRSSASGRLTPALPVCRASGPAVIIRPIRPPLPVLPPIQRIYLYPQMIRAELGVIRARVMPGL